MIHLSQDVRNEPLLPTCLHTQALSSSKALEHLHFWKNVRGTTWCKVHLVPCSWFPQSLRKLLESRQQVGTQGWSASRVISRTGLGLLLPSVTMTEALALVPLVQMQSRGNCLPSSPLHQGSILTFFTGGAAPRHCQGLGLPPAWLRGHQSR